MGKVISWTIGSLTSGQTITHEFVVTATTTITNDQYRVSAAGGYSATGSLTVVTIVDIPIDGLAATNDGPTVLGSPTALSATVAAGTNVEYTWDFGDGAGGNGAFLTHVYSSVGVYTAVMTAANSTSQVTATTTVTVAEVITGLTISSTSPDILGETTTFTATISTGSDVIFAWDFGDTSSGTGAIVNHTYASTGAYLVVVTATNSVSSATVTTTVIITNPVFRVHMPVALKP